MERIETTIYASELINWEVVGHGGWVIGKVKDIIFDDKTWLLTTIDLQLEARLLMSSE